MPSDDSAKRTLFGQYALWDDRCCGDSKRSVISHLPVPFALRVGRTRNGHPTFSEGTKQGAWGMLAIATLMVICALMGAAILVGSFVSSQPMQPAGVLMFLIGTTMSLFMLGIWRRSSTTLRRLVMYESDLSLAVQIVRTPDRVESETRLPLTECRLSLRQVRLEADRFPSFEGWLARVEVGDRCFTLACCKAKDEVLRYIQTLPPGLLAIYSGEGEPLNGMMTDRHLSNRTRVVKSSTCCDGWKSDWNAIGRTAAGGPTSR